MADTFDSRVLWMDKLVGIFKINFLPYFLTVLYQLAGGIILNALKILLGVNNSIIVASIGDIKNKFS